MYRETHVIPSSVTGWRESWLHLAFLKERGTEELGQKSGWQRDNQSNGPLVENRPETWGFRAREKRA